MIEQAHRRLAVSIEEAGHALGVDELGTIHITPDDFNSLCGAIVKRLDSGRHLVDCVACLIEYHGERHV